MYFDVCRGALKTLCRHDPLSWYLMGGIGHTSRPCSEVIATATEFLDGNTLNDQITNDVVLHRLVEMLKSQ